MKFTPKPRR